MFTKKINKTILLVSQLLNVGVTIYFVVLFSHLVWWIFTPNNDNNVYLEKVSVNQYDDDSAYIMNRYPFGIIEKVKESATPQSQIANHIKLTGIYFNPPRDSIAIIEYNQTTTTPINNSNNNMGNNQQGYNNQFRQFNNGASDNMMNNHKSDASKTATLKIGATILSGATVEAINSDNIVVNENGHPVTLKINSGESLGAKSSISYVSQPNRVDTMSRIARLRELRRHEALQHNVANNIPAAAQTNNNINPVNSTNKESNHV